MLAGNWPYCSVNDIEKHPDELLRARLQCTDLNQSLVEQDLMELGDGLEGRSMNPVSLLVCVFAAVTSYANDIIFSSIS